MKSIFTVLLIFTSTLIVNCQDYILKAGFKDLPYKKIYLAAVSGEKIKFIDSASTDFTGGFRFKFNNKSALGQYKIYTESQPDRQGNNKKNLIDFIFNKENIEFYSTSQNILDSISNIKSKENSIYFDYLRKRNENKIKLDLINNLLANYPATDDFYASVEKQSSFLQTSFNDYINAVITKNPDAFVSHLIKIEKLVIVDSKLSDAQRNQYLKLHFFDEVNFNDTLLVNSSFLTTKVISYLSLYREKQATKDSQEIEFIKAVDFIMKVADKNKKVYEFILDYLITGFEKFDYTNIINYIADNSRIERFCENDNKTTLETKIESYKKFSVGKTVPDININDINGKTIKLSDIKTEYILLLFWASWCNHCEEFIPEILKVYNSQSVKKFEVLSISIDEKKDEWIKAVDKFKTQWIDCAELKGWDGKTVKDYCIYATPTLYLIDKNKTIIAKPLSIEELQQAISK